VTKMDFPWQALKVICEGTSIIDIPRLEVASEAEAHQFLASYGYDLFEPTHREQIWKFHEEACLFLEGTLGVKIPSSIRNRNEIGDFRNLLVAASTVSGLPQSKDQRHACALLRVMHVLSHIKNDLRLKYIAKVRKQTIGRFDAHVQVKNENGEEKFYLGFDTGKIPLVRFEKKEGKNRSRVLMKLLQKPASVAQEVYDHLGVRFVTRTRGEAILVIKYLLDHHLISVANVIGARCRNTLFSLADFQDHLKKTKSMGEDFFEKLEAKLDFPTTPFGVDNPFSSPDYHALQFTCRPLIRIPVVKKGGVRAEVSFFFPLEIQILDEVSYAKSQTGDAMHSAYKEKQLEAVKGRIFGALK
jgi:uncharacterized protein (TIGR04562 family)